VEADAEVTTAIRGHVVVYQSSEQEFGVAILLVAKAIAL
jgi:hypothetical protein